MFKNTDKALKSAVLGSAIALVSTYSASSSAGSITQAVKTGKEFMDFRLRYENVDAEGASKVDALTLRSRLGYKTGSANGFSALIEFEDVRPALGINEDDAANPNTIPDASEPYTELDQGFIQYKQGDKFTGFTAKLGRQVLTLDGHRHVGHVGWRQDRQTFDAGRLTWKPTKALTLDYAHVYRVNRINSPTFADFEETSIDLYNISYKTPYGKAVVYHYGTSDESFLTETETTGVSFGGKTKLDSVTLLYNAEYASQDNKTLDVTPEYIWVEGGFSASGVTAKVGVEVLGSDEDDSGNLENFLTPLATVHKFQGWADVFLGGSLRAGGAKIAGGKGIVDTYASIGGKVGGVKLLAVYHIYEADKSSDDLGSEVNLLAVKKFGKFYSVGAKYAAYSGGDDFGTDVDKGWVWVGAKF